MAACVAEPAVDSALRFDNVTREQVSALPESSYRFDALFTDFNGDGCADPYIHDHANPATSRLWLARCDGSSRFDPADVAQTRHFIADPPQPQGSGWISLIDHNGDGRQDFWQRNASTRYINDTPRGQHTPYFAKKERGCDSNSCTFGDIDGDGRLDVIGSDRSVRDANSGRLISAASGDDAAPIIGDVDGDGWADIVQPKLGGYWHNQRGKLSWRGVPGLHGGSYLMALADFDNDGYVDLFILDGPECNEPARPGRASLWQNDRRGGFVDVSADSGLASLPFVGCQTNYGNVIAADFDNDGLADLLVAGSSPSYQILRNQGGMRFARSTVDLGGAGGTAKARVAVADFDNDGRLDILTTQAETNLGLWRNRSDTGSAHWMKVRVRGAVNNADGIATDLRFYRVNTTQLLAHYQVQANDQHAQTWIHAGIGDAAKIDLRVGFSAASKPLLLKGLDSNQEVIVYANGCVIEHWKPGHGWPLQPPLDCVLHGADVVPSSTSGQP
ncbi:MAG: VCBS repeat-containing protein [Dokdonella sp.]